MDGEKKIEHVLKIQTIAWRLFIRFLTQTHTHAHIHKSNGKSNDGDERKRERPHIVDSFCYFFSTVVGLKRAKWVSARERA